MARPGTATRRGGPFQLGLLLLLYQVLAMGLERVPPVTLAAVALQSCIFAGILDPGWGSPAYVCLRPSSVLAHGDLRRVFFSSLEHVSDLHLYFNMISLIWKGRRLEKRYGSMAFAALLVFFMGFTGIVHVALAKLAAEIFKAIWSFIQYLLILCYRTILTLASVLWASPASSSP